MTTKYKQLMDLYIENNPKTNYDTILTDILLEKPKKRSEFVNILLVYALKSKDRYTNLYIANIIQETLNENSKSLFDFQWDDPFVSKELMKLLDETNQEIKKIKKDVYQKNLLIAIMISFGIILGSINFLHAKSLHILLAVITFLIFYAGTFYLFEAQRQEAKITKTIFSQANKNIVEYINKVILK